MIPLIVTTYIVLANAFGLFLMAWDKRQSMRGGWRIAEKTLLGLAVLGGGLGIYCGMRIFRHKTRHPRFSYGVPAILLVQAAGLALWLRGA